MRKTLFALFILCVFSASIFAETVLNQTFTGQQIYNTASFPNSTKSLSGTSLVINFSSGGPYVLFLFPFLQANTLSNASAATVNVTVNFTRNIADYDPYFMITDGLNAVGTAIWDNDGGYCNLYSAQQPTTNTLSNFQSYSSVSGTGYPGTGGSSSVTFSVTINPQSAAQASVTFYSTSRSATTSVILDASRGLSFLASNDTNDSSYRIDSVSFQVNGVVPEPSTLGLVFMVLSFFIFLKRK
ncbi:MAG: PEP-CTERM sorting domain-containing protein [Candidatus Brocadiae bacterium]|nr:PEP-CTERM sorting domain-containing protein [Candidatus Brocadiia bacterium]